MTLPDPVEILASLGRTATATAVPVSGGADATIWRVEQSSSTFALRLLRPEQAGQATVEGLAMSAAAAAGVLVPRIIESGFWNRRPVMLLEWSAGKTLAETLLLDSIGSNRAEALGNRFGESQAALHRVSPPPDLPADWIDWPAANSELDERFSTIEPRDPVLIHLDYHPLNVLIDGERISAVLDWANAHAGDPRADLARTIAIIQLAPIPDHIDPIAFEAIRQPFEQGWRHGYQASGGTFDCPEPFRRWAGLGLLHELTPRLGRPDLPWLTAEYIDRVRRWTDEWKSKITRVH